MDDLISRQEAIDTCLRMESVTGYDAGCLIAQLPSAQPECKTDGDTISRQAAIDALGEEPEVWGEKDDYDMGLNNQWNSDKDAIMEVQTASPRWIPVSERLPESKDERVLVCGERGGITIARYFANQDYGGGFQHTFWVQGNKTMKVIAWMPLPEPWEGEDDADNSQI